MNETSEQTEDAPPVLTVVIVTYNHELYIRQAIDSVLMQETSFAFEVIISEDRSTDSTADIVREYQNKYEDTIVSIFSEENLNNNDVVTRAIGRARGDFVAFLDGDDYWVSADKLQKQFDFMYAHPDSVITYHDVARVGEDGKVIRLMRGSDRRATIDDLIQGNFLTSCSCVVRKSAIANPPDWIRDLESGDWPYHLWAAQSGFIDHIDGLLAHYRVHGAAAWSTKSLAEQWVRSLSILLDVQEHLGSVHGDAFARSRRNIIGNILAAVSESSGEEGASSAMSLARATGDESDRALRLVAKEATVRAWETEIRNRELELEVRAARMEAERHSASAADAVFNADYARRRLAEAEARVYRVETDHSGKLARLVESEAARQAVAGEREALLSRAIQDLADRDVKLEATQRTAAESEESLSRALRVLADRDLEVDKHRALEQRLLEADERLHRERKRLRKREKLAISIMGAVIIALVALLVWIALSS